MRLGRRSWPAYGAFGVLGFVAGVALVVVLARDQGRSPGTTALLIAVSLAASYLVTLATKVVTGADTHRYLHHQLGLLVLVPGALWLLGEPVLSSLDIVLMGQSTVLAIGRLGCLMAGCCHGKPAGWGVRYREAHVDSGFARELARVRLFPLQLVEFAAVLALVAAGSALILGGAEAGSASGVYVVGYGLVRFVLEYHRGDHTRRFLRGVSNVQWTILAIVATWVALEAAGVLPLAYWHVLALALMAAAAAFARPRLLLQSPHLHEVASVVRQLDAAPAELRVHTTSLGVSISAGVLERDGVRFRHYSLSQEGGLDDDGAGDLATLVGRLEDTQHELVAGGHGVFHVLVPAQRSSAGTGA